MIIWISGLSGSGKTTLMNKMVERMENVVTFDSDDIRLSQDFTLRGKMENVEHLERIARHIHKQGFDVIVACIQTSPNVDFTEIHMTTPLTVCIERDAKGLYAKALKGKLLNLAGVNATYYPPEKPNITIDSSEEYDTKSIVHRALSGT